MRESKIISEKFWEIFPQGYTHTPTRKHTCIRLPAKNYISRRLDYSEYSDTNISKKKIFTKTASSMRKKNYEQHIIFYSFLPNVQYSYRWNRFGRKNRIIAVHLCVSQVQWTDTFKVSRGGKTDVYLTNRRARRMQHAVVLAHVGSTRKVGIRCPTVAGPQNRRVR